MAAEDPEVRTGGSSPGARRDGCIRGATGNAAARRGRAQGRTWRGVEEWFPASGVAGDAPDVCRGSVSAFGRKVPRPMLAVVRNEAEIV